MSELRDLRFVFVIIALFMFGNIMYGMNINGSITPGAQKIAILNDTPDNIIKNRASSTMIENSHLSI